MACKVCFAKKTFSPLVRDSCGLESVIVNSLRPFAFGSTCNANHMGCRSYKIRADIKYYRNIYLISRK
ncbi:hypothetical protein EQP49_18940 [Yersinia sp. 2105 StPb PI]|nr:hypothetical protein EQP49_18940 [Yersinia sp. 2105 StPb PI]